jgi:hypothetical protein
MAKAAKKAQAAEAPPPEPSPPPAAALKDRIVELRRVRAGDLRPNPRNWRRHPKSQRSALLGILGEVGIADAVLARVTDDGGLELIDGHLRQDAVDANQELPVLVLDVSEAESDKLLLTLDPLAALAQTDDDAVRALLERVQVESDDVRKMVTFLAKAPAQPPEQFQALGAQTFDHRCPKCGFEFDEDQK